MQFKFQTQVKKVGVEQIWPVQLDKVQRQPGWLVQI
jgi:hypothetical protein